MKQKICNCFHAMLCILTEKIMHLKFCQFYDRNLKKATDRIEKLQKGLEDVDRRVEEYKNKFQKLNEDATKLKIKLEKEQETIASAENLIGKLDGEYERWSAQVSGCQWEWESGAL